LGEETAIRKAKTKDLKQLNALNKELQLQMQRFRMKKLPKKQLEKEKFSKTGLKGAFVAEAEGTLVGFACFNPNALDNEWCGKCIELEEIFVKPKFSGKKLGKHLLEKLLQQARKKKANIRLMMSPKNKKALSFYKKHGFETVGYEMVKKWK
jgi:GNAT superfamily N-acetyltransferase